MSRLIKIDHDIKLSPEPEGYEFGCYAFDYDSDILVNAVQAIQDNTNHPITNDLNDIDLPLTDELFLNPFDTYRIRSYLTVWFFLRSCCS